MIRLGIHHPVFVSLTLACVAAVWWGCSPSADHQTTTTLGTGGVGAGGAGGAGGTGGTVVTFDGGPDSSKDSGACVATSAAAEPITVDIVFLIDQSGSMSGVKWMGTTSALTTFFNDPASAGIGAGISFFPDNLANTCVVMNYESLVVPIDVLPNNAFALTNALPADAKGSGTPMYVAVEGALMAATAYQDAHPQHKVILVLATDGDPNGCGTATVADIADLAQGALSYDGVRTYVIGVQGSTIANLDMIAAAGGTTAAYDITSDITQFSTKMAEIRSAVLACEFQLPAPPPGETLDTNKVNFSYTPKGMGMPTTLLRSTDLADCDSGPGWYYDSDADPTKIILCPASCSTVQADAKAKVSVLFGCESEFK
jgi:hypothetical protein